MGRTPGPQPAPGNVGSLRRQTIFRALGIQPILLLLQRFRGKPVQEGRSAAVVEDCWPAAFASLVHFPGLIAVLIVSYFNWKGYYIGGELSGPSGYNSLKLAALQLTSKFLDAAFIAVSISVIVFRFIRRELAFGDGVSFGALTSALQLSQISFIWSKEFFATCSTPFCPLWKKVFFAALLAIGGMLCLLVGPSMATLLLPTLADWPAGGTQLWLNRSSDEIWPSHLHAVSPSVGSCSSENSLDCLSNVWSALSTGFFPYWPEVGSSAELAVEMVETVMIPGRNSLRNLALSPRGPFLFRPDLTCATVQQATVADALAEARSLWFRANQHACHENSGFCFYNDIKWSIEAPQPVAFVRCNATLPNAVPRYPILGSSFDNYEFAENSKDASESRDWLARTLSNGTSSDVLWVDLEDAIFGENVAGALLAIPSPRDFRDGLTAFACTIDARWAKVEMTASFLNGPHIISGKPENWLEYARLQHTNDSDDWGKVKLDPEWLSALDSLFHEQGNIASNQFLNTLTSRQSYTDLEDGTNAVEALLAALVAHTMSLTGHDATIQGTLKTKNNGGDWKREILPINTVYGNGGVAFAVDASVQNLTRSTRLQFLARVNGYGYGLSTATILASIVLWFYAAIVVCHLISLDPIYSSCWDSFSEVATLAMASTPPAEGVLQRPGTVISTMRPLQQVVRVVVRDGKRLEFMFGTGLVAAEERVQTNTIYG